MNNKGNCQRWCIPLGRCATAYRIAWFMHNSLILSLKETLYFRTLCQQIFASCRVQLFRGLHRHLESLNSLRIFSCVLCFILAVEKSFVPFILFYFILFYFILFIYCLFRATLRAYGGSQARGPVGAVAASLCQSHSNSGSEPRLQPTPQLTTVLDHNPLSETRDRTRNLMVTSWFR